MQYTLCWYCWGPAAQRSSQPQTQTDPEFVRSVGARAGVKGADFVASSSHPLSLTCTVAGGGARFISGLSWQNLRQFLTASEYIAKEQHSIVLKKHQHTSTFVCTSGNSGHCSRVSSMSAWHEWQAWPGLRRRESDLLVLDSAPASRINRAFTNIDTLCIRLPGRRAQLLECTFSSDPGPCIPLKISETAKQAEKASKKA